MRVEKLTEGNINQVLIKLALPIMGSAFIQMSYSMMDMFWLGRLSSASLSAAGGVGNLLWIALSIVVLLRIGTEVGVGQTIGRENREGTRGVKRAGAFSALFFGVLIGVIFFLFYQPLLSLFRFQSPEILNLSYDYMRIMAFALPSMLLNPVISAIYHGEGNSKTPFYINTVGVVLNIVLDPILIFSFNMGIQGAAYATVTANIVVTLLFFLARRTELSEYGKSEPILPYFKEIVGWGMPPAFQNLVFSGVGIFMARQMNSFSDAAYAAFQIGVQVESIGWLSFGGFSTAISAFVAQNFGAGEDARLFEGYHLGKGMIVKISLGVSAVMILFAEPIMQLFIPTSEEAVGFGIEYLRICGVVQIFSAWEAAATGAFQGMGLTKYSSIGGVLGSIIRIPFAILLTPLFGVRGIWYAIALSMICKGLIIRGTFEYKFRSQITGEE